MSLSVDLDANDIAAGPMWIRVLRALIFSPSGRFIVLFRLAQLLHHRGGISRLLGKLVWNLLVSNSGCHVSLLASIGAGVKVPHPIGIVIGEGVRIGSGCTLYQHVTIGRKRADVEAYPLIADHVVLYVGAVVMGAITVNAGASVGAYAVVVKDVAAGETVVGAPARPVNNRS